MTGPATPAGHLLQTALHSLHLELGARMVPFAGYEMPVQYRHGIIREHQHARTRAALFDISHMGQIEVRGERAGASLERLVPSDVCDMAPYQQRYSVLTNAQGGISDDLMITRLPGSVFLVVNAACKHQDFEYLRTEIGGDCDVIMHTDRALLALQGPEACAVLGALNAAVSGLKFLRAGEFALAGVSCLVHRCGYTGEDGFEISLDAAHAPAIARRLLQHAAVEPAGLGARDSLRLEAGLCLYGHDIDAMTTPVEAGLGWVIARRHRSDPALARFPGASGILSEIRNGAGRLRVGLRPEGRVPVREGAVILGRAGGQAGRVTSGGFGPTINGPIAMGYVAAGLAAPGTELEVEIRGRSHIMRVAALPFVKHRYHH